MSEREEAIIAELKVEYKMFTQAINALIESGKRFSPEAGRLASERSKIKLALSVHRIALREAKAREEAKRDG